MWFFLKLVTWEHSQINHIYIYTSCQDGQRTAAAYGKGSGEFPSPHNLILFIINDSLMQMPSTRSQPSPAFSSLSFQETQEYSCENTFQNCILFIPNITRTTTTKTKHLPHNRKSYSHCNYHRDYSRHYCSSQTQSENVCAKASSASKPVINFCKIQQAWVGAQSLGSPCCVNTFLRLFSPPLHCLSPAAQQDLWDCWPGTAELQVDPAAHTWPFFHLFK